MRILLLVGLASLLLASCAVSPNSENTQTGDDLDELSSSLGSTTADNTTGTNSDNNSSQAELPGVLLFDFNDPNQAWFTVDDNVMGGVSSSSGQILEEGTLMFSGTMSLENNGGFSSLRSNWAPIDLSGSDGLLIRALGDGNIYRMRVRTTATGRDVSYNSFFETEDGEWTTVYIPFNTMVPTIMGFQVSSGELDPSKISSFGFMLSDKQPGDFSLQVDWIRSVTEAELFPEG
jgi:hypothetical protein